MRSFFQLAFILLVFASLFPCIGCNDSPRVVQETDEFKFDDMAAQATADTELSEIEE